MFADWKIASSIRCLPQSAKFSVRFNMKITSVISIIFFFQNNQCATNNGGCDQLCFALPDNSKVCDCSYGVLAPDGLKCTGKKLNLNTIMQKLASENHVFRNIAGHNSKLFRRALIAKSWPFSYMSCMIHTLFGCSKKLSNLHCTHGITSKRDRSGGVHFRGSALAKCATQLQRKVAAVASG